MLKIRITFVDSTEGNKEVLGVINNLEEKHIILNKSKLYKGHGNSKYNNIYLDVEAKISEVRN